MMQRGKVDGVGQSTWRSGCWLEERECQDGHWKLVWMEKDSMRSGSHQQVNLQVVDVPGRKILVGGIFNRFAKLVDGGSAFFIGELTTLFTEQTFKGTH